jgi:hypothetical protein
MSLRFPRGAVAVALIASLLVAIPACKKKKPPTDPTPTPAPQQPGPSTNPGQGTGLNFGLDNPPPPQGPFFANAFEGPMRTPAQNDLKQIMLGLHNFHDTYHALPAGYADKTGKPGLSWRVAVLPFIEQDALFRQFKLDEPWDSESNKKLITMMPKTYAPPQTRTNGYTFYRGFTGPNTWLPPQTQPGTPGKPLLGVKLFDIRDGTSNTILVAEALDPVIWTKPDELQFTPGKPPKLGGVFGSGFLVGMADGSTRFVRKTVSGQSISDAIQINDGKPVNLDD